MINYIILFVATIVVILVGREIDESEKKKNKKN